MDLEVVGRHALFFDDDAMAAFVNSAEALVEWHSLQIDRYDVRHLLSAPPPSRRRNRNSDVIIISDEPSELNHERYLDLPLESDQPELEEYTKASDTGGYRAVAFSYGNPEDPTDSNNVAAGTESSGFHPPFPLPENLLQSLPPTEKIHQIIARTAIFVSKHGGQSEIILRVKQGDNPTFGFLMPDHHLHAYFRFLVEHPECLNSAFDGRTQSDGKNDGSEHNNPNGVGGALSLLGSAYGTGEEEDGDVSGKAEDIPHDNITDVPRTISHGLKKMESKTDSDKDDAVSKNPILSNKEKVIAVKKNSAMTAAKYGSVKGAKKEEKSGLLSAAAGKTRSLATGVASKFEPLILEPSPELKRSIDKLVEFIIRNGRQFEATLIEQDREHGRFPFLLPSNQYHSYYLKVLQTAQEGKVKGKSSHHKNASALKENDFMLASACDIPLESDRKEKFKMVISKPKKETQETESKGIQQACGTTVDAAAAAAILQAATRGIKNSNWNGSRDASVLGAASLADFSETPLTEEQKLKAERLRRAKMFVAMLKSGAVNSKTEPSRGSSVEPQGSNREVNLNGKEREGSLAPADVDRPPKDEKPDRNYFGEEHDERHSKRKYRSRSGGCEDDYEDEDKKDNDKHHKRRKYRSKSRRYEEDDEKENAVETEQKHKRRRHRSHSSSEDYEDEGKGHKDCDSENEDKHKVDKDHIRSRRKHHSHHHERSRKRHSSKQHSDEEDEHEDEVRDCERSSKKHRSSDNKDKRRHRHSSREKESRRHRKHHSSSDDEHKNEDHVQRDELEEGEISSRVSGESRGIASGHVSRETSVDATNIYQRATSLPSEAASEVPDDLRAKIRAMLMATRL